MGHSKNSPKRNSQHYLKKQEISQIKNLTLHLKKLEKEQQRQPKVSRRQEIIRMRTEINEIEFKKKYKRAMKPRTGSLKR